MHWTATATLLWTVFCSAQDPIRPYPLPDADIPTTAILDHLSYVQGLDDPQWYLDNIPFVDFPDQSLNDVYYYRTSVIKRHLKYAHEGHGWVFTEFIHPVNWASKFQTIPDSAAHQILEARWLRDPNYSKDVINLYTRAGIEAVSGITYTHYVHDAIYEHAQATGDTSFLTSQLDGMIKTYNLWNVTIDPTAGLYHRNPLQDAQEYSLPGYLTGGPNGGAVQTWNDPLNDYNTIWLGPETYRPNFNAYMVAGARAISQVASLAGNDDLAAEWDSSATALYNRMHDQLYDTDLKFWIDVVEGTNLQCRGRELIGYFPYRFGVGVDQDIVQGLEEGLTPEAFITEFGPTTLEQTNPYFTALKNTTYCCIWQGQSWPFSTSVYLGTLARLARLGNNSVATPELFQSAMSAYTRTNYKDGVPFTAESHYPTVDMWSGDTTNHSEHYLHSTYLDNVFTNLLGIIPTLDDRLEMQPLVPSNWTYFAVENLPYHGNLMSILYDASGTHYTRAANNTPGLSIYANGQLVHNQPTLSAVNISLPSTSSSNSTNPPSSNTTSVSSTPRYVNILANPNTPHSLPLITADFTLSPNSDGSPSWSAWKLNDGLLWYDTPFPDNFWTNNQSTTPTNTLTITLPRARTFSSISLAILADVSRGGVIDCPASIVVANAATANASASVRANNGTTLARRDPWPGCVPNALNTIAFDAGPVTTDRITVTLANKLRYAVALSEIQIWVPSTASYTPTTSSPSSSPLSSPSTSSSSAVSEGGRLYPAADALPGTFIGGFTGRASGMNSTYLPGGAGVAMSTGAWLEWGGVYSGLGAGGTGGGRGGLSVVPAANATAGDGGGGDGGGEVDVQINFLRNETVMLVDGGGVVRVDVGGEGEEGVPWLEGGNVVTLWWRSGRPAVGGIVVGG